MVANAWQQYMWTDKTFGQETMMGVLPFFHSYGVSATVLGGAMMGATLGLASSLQHATGHAIDGTRTSHGLARRARHVGGDERAACVRIRST